MNSEIFAWNLDGLSLSLHLASRDSMVGRIFEFHSRSEGLIAAFHAALREHPGRLLMDDMCWFLDQMRTLLLCYYSLNDH
jgi:hypothetical protein